MRSLTILFLLGGLVHHSVAQEKPAVSRLTVRSVYAVALMNGSASTSFNVQTVQGLSYNKSFAGVGIGLDYYKFRSVPLFLQLRQQLGKGKRNIMLYANGGRNIDWLTDKTKEVGFGNDVKYKGGWYYDLGLGYKIELKNDNAFFLTTGYSFKQVRKHVYYKTCFVTGQCTDDVDRYMYTMPCIAVRAAFQF